MDYVWCASAPPVLIWEQSLTSTVAFSVQPAVEHEDTFLPHIVSMEKHEYELMVNEMRLPYKGIESSDVLGPFFWYRHINNPAGRPHLRKFPALTNVFLASSALGSRLILQQISCSANPT